MCLRLHGRGGALYDKFVGLVDDLVKLGNQMDLSKKSYQEAMKKLYDGSGNLVRRAENIRELGAKVKKKLPASLIERVNGETQ